MTHEELFAATSIKSWTIVISRLEKMLSSFQDSDFQKEISPGRNRVYYLVGHLAAIHDRMLPMLGIGERLYPQLDAAFIDSPDRSSEDKFTGTQLRTMLAEVNAGITKGLHAMKPADLLERHTAVSEEDFAKDPLRNRLAVLESRTSHVMFHMGQIRLIR